ncbi:MAG: NUDIX domain-containing protein [Candidatus Dormibacteraeota bacterium]|nr:NUDIX domain-containing protein [Candidatus Dormibacteraeota bacterium]
MIAVLEQVERPFDRDAQLTHVTASAIVVGCRGTLLHVHRRLARWLQPGGHVDPGEEPAAAALRETREETGVCVRHPLAGPALIHVDAHPALDHLHLDLRYLIEAGPDDPHPPPDESPQVRWFSWEEAAQVADVSLAAALAAARWSL